MKIQNLLFGDTNIRNILGDKTSKISQEKRSTRVDSVKISATVPGLNQSDNISYEIEPEYPPRTELIGTVSERVARGTYNGVLLESVAQKVVDSPGVVDVVTEVTMDNLENPDERSMEVNKAADQANKGYYDSPMMMKEIADRIITELGLVRLVK